LRSGKEKEKRQVEKNDDRQKGVDKMSPNKLRLRADALKYVDLTYTNMGIWGNEVSK
jgi:hypothetical protein